MHTALILYIIGSTFCLGYAFYDKSDSVIELTAKNFKSQVINDDSIWIVEFYAPWCGHCKNLVPEYKKTAAALKGIVKVGAIDMDVHKSIGGTYNVQGFPTIKIFGTNKNQPVDYKGKRTAQAIVDSVLSEVRNAVDKRIGGGSSRSFGSNESKSKSSGGKTDVITLTDSNFDELVLNSKDLWLVEFFAPWCGHCINLEPHWKAAASELKGKVKLGALDATAHTIVSSRFGIKGFPTIKFFGAGEKTDSDAVDYNGGRTTNDIVQWANAKVSENRPAPEVKQAISNEVVEDACKNNQLCIVAILPNIIDCQSECRNNYIKVLKECAEKFKKNAWGWLWAEAFQQPKLEKAFDIGGFGYPAMVAVNSRKLKYSTLTSSFDKVGISEFLRDLSYGKGKTSSLHGTEFPAVVTIDAWDGKDGVAPDVEELDLSDVELDDLDKTEL